MKIKAKCPVCTQVLEVDIPANSKAKDLAEMSREGRLGRGFAGLRCDVCSHQGDAVTFDERWSLPKVKTAYLEKDGLVTSYDADGKTVAECNGFVLEVATELKFRCDVNTEWYLKVDLFGPVSIDLAWWFGDKPPNRKRGTK